MLFLGGRQLQIPGQLKSRRMVPDLKLEMFVMAGNLDADGLITLFGRRIEHRIVAGLDQRQLTGVGI